MSLFSEEVLIYGATCVFSVLVIFIYVWKGAKKNHTTKLKVELAKEEGRFVPNSLHPYIDLNKCIGSGACIKSCPEKDILGILDQKATVINATHCIGHGACFHACPVEAISLRIGTEKRGVELPHVRPTYETNIKGIYIAGELGGMGLIKNSVEQGKQAVENMVKSKKPKVIGALDLVIVGAGPAGIAGALSAKMHNLEFAILEQDTLGGTVATYPRSKIIMTSPADLPLYGKMKVNLTSKDELLTIWQDALRQNDIAIHEKTKVENIIPLESGAFKVVSKSGEEWITTNVLMAIGRRGTPRKLNIPGEESSKVAYRLLEPENISGKKIVVVGGGDSAVESAMLLMDQNEVILSYRKENFARIKPLNAVAIKDAIASGKIKAMFNSNLINITPDHVQIQTGDKGEAVRLENDLIYIFIGGELPLTFLQSTGIQITKRFGQILKKH